MRRNDIDLPALSADHRQAQAAPRWQIWHGHTTGSYWALPPRDHPTQHNLIGASDLDELAQRLAQAEEQHDL